MFNTHAERSSINQFFQGFLAAGDWKRLYSHLTACTDCRTVFEEARVALRSLGSPADGGPRLSRPEADLIEAAVLAQVAAPRRRARAWVSGLAVAAAGVALFVVVPRTKTESDGFTARSVNATAAGLDVLCIPSVETAPSVSMRGAGVQAPGCAAGNYLKVLATAPESQQRFVTAVALDEKANLRFITQGQDLTAAQSVLPGHTSQSAERLLFVALFSDKALDRTLVEAAVRNLRSTGAPVNESARLPVDASVQQRTLLVSAAVKNDAR